MCYWGWGWSVFVIEVIVMYDDDDNECGFVLCIGGVYVCCGVVCGIIICFICVGLIL